MVTNNKIILFLENITQWAAAQPDIQALALVGSYARGTETDISDIDLIFITVEPKFYLDNTDWIQQFGIIEKQQIEYYGLVTSIRVWYINGFEIEYGITDERWVSIPLNAGTRQVISDGMQILFERGNILSRHQSTSPELPYSESVKE